MYGTYLHGLFDRPETTRALVRALMRQKGLDPASVQALDMETYKQRQYDLLADGMRQSLNMDEIYKIVEEGL